MKERLIPIVLLSNRKLVKTRSFKNPIYVGDPRNVVRIFSDFQVDELIVFDIQASQNQEPIDFEMLESIADEAKMPIAYGGGVTSQNARQVLSLGYEKIVLNSMAYRNPFLITECSEKFGSQAVAVSIDVREYKGVYSCWSKNGRQPENIDPLTWAKKCEDLGAGEIIVTVINKEGSWGGTDIHLCQSLTAELSIPLVINGGMGKINDAIQAIDRGGASAVAAGSFFVFQEDGKGVLISYPEVNELKRFL